MINITSEAIADISEYYQNVMQKYPNTWDAARVKRQIDVVVDDIEIESNRIVSLLNHNIHGIVKSPLLKSLQTYGAVEAFAKKTHWQFTLRYDKEADEFYVENAIKGENMSNQAFRRGNTNPSSPLSNDERKKQKKLWESLGVPISKYELETVIQEAITDALDEVNERKQNESLKKKIRNVVKDYIRDTMWQLYKGAYPELYADIQSGKRTDRGNGKYKDNLVFGWNMVEWKYKQTNTDKDTLEALHKSYDRYGEDCAKKGEIPCDTGFDIWCRERGDISDFPNYY